MKIKMTVEKNGYPPVGEVLDVSEERATRWVLGMEIAEFPEKKDRQAIVKKLEEREKQVKEADKKLAKELDALDKRGE